MRIEKSETREALGEKAGRLGAAWIKEAIETRGEANIILATGQSQFETMETLVNDKEIDWSKVRMFHLDEYIGMPITHKASFRKYLTERFVNKVEGLLDVVLINGENNPEEECTRLGKKIAEFPIDVAFVGIGENGHLAFNDPPADFEVEDAYLVVNLDAQCRQQQLGEGWFETVDDVPLQAISMSIKQIMKSRKIVCAVPDSRKAKAVRACLSEPVSVMSPASILQQHEHCVVFLDKDSASLL
ncbi:glucosamine-6-phosphate deaminase [Sphingobacterium sp. UT-1RO-CII-1]|uniref:glucosamine-6-phosphate deaminase n=1 Tax=Sphingobacterium sp. UT-1RO-CII-1 TaxID=2995225 RepID=UPI00227A2336|nr:glucosamine-6-phosphate deaminase [Sphingobacterium sp. UT-1RO-CII-1]MCY4780651.1 glucosamine-6-phosphate deaminase [Sphingobacterium sp. UT-1RO-CII-1]